MCTHGTNTYMFIYINLVVGGGAFYNVHETYMETHNIHVLKVES